MNGLLVLAIAAAVCLSAAPAFAQSTERDSSSAPADTLPPAIEVPRRPVLALGEIALINVMVWSYDRFIRSGDTSGFDIGPDSWWANIEHGFEYDDNHFKTNQWAHPYQGSLNFNTARTNGYGYWGSVPFSFVGSLMWEYMMEANPPAINDWINTSVGGAALGESFYRLSSMILDNRATGSSRVFREIAATLVNPVRGFNRLIHGRMSHVTQNPADWRPNHLFSHFLTGARTVGEGEVFNQDTTDVYVELDFLYGDPFKGAYRKPYQTFLFELQLDFGDDPTFARAQVGGILFGIPLGDSRPIKHMFTGWQRFDYLNNPVYEFGGQSATVGYLGQFGSKKLLLDVSAEVGWLMLGATSTDYANFTGRDYDYGMGVQYRVGAELTHNGRQIFLLRNGMVWQETLNGNDVLHRVMFTRARLNIPVFRFVGVGAEYVLYYRKSDYANFPDVTQDTPELRAFLSWNL